MRRIPIIGLVLAAALAAAPAALAAPPEHAPMASGPIEFVAGEVCDDAILFETPVLRGMDTAFAPGPGGTSTYISRGSAVSLVTNLRTDETHQFVGGVRIAYRFHADGSTRVDASGTGFIAWYYDGDDSELGPGLFHVSGHVTEWYAPDGTFIRAEHTGIAEDLCAVVGA
jgi:hypothetical protein